MLKTTRQHKSSVIIKWYCEPVTENTTQKRGDKTTLPPSNAEQVIKIRHCRFAVPGNKSGRPTKFLKLKSDCMRPTKNWNKHEMCLMSSESIYRVITM